jgi:hypothetical protein
MPVHHLRELAGAAVMTGGVKGGEVAGAGACRGIRTESPAAIGFQLSLSRLPAAAGGALRTGRKPRSHPAEGDAGLSGSVTRALAEKLPKLARARPDAEASILLI